MAKRKVKGKPSSHNGYALFDASTSGLPQAQRNTGLSLLEEFGNWMATLKPIHSVVSHVLSGTLMTRPLPPDVVEAAGDAYFSHDPESPTDYLAETIKRFDDLIEEAQANAGGDQSAMAVVAVALKDELKAMIDAMIQGEVARAVNAAMAVGYRICQLEVLPHDAAAMSGKVAREGALGGHATRISNAAERRKATQKAVRERWDEVSPEVKLSLFTIQKDLAQLKHLTKKLKSGEAASLYGSLATIQANTKGMKRSK